MRVYLEVEVRRVECKGCDKVKQERLEWLADHPFYTKRFAFFVGRRCRAMTIKDVAQETRLDWKTIVNSRPNCATNVRVIVHHFAVVVCPSAPMLLAGLFGVS